MRSGTRGLTWCASWLTICLLASATLAEVMIPRLSIPTVHSCCFSVRLESRIRFVKLAHESFCGDAAGPQRELAVVTRREHLLSHQSLAFSLDQASLHGVSAASLRTDSWKYLVERPEVAVHEQVCPDRPYAQHADEGLLYVPSAILPEGLHNNKHLIT